VLSHSAILPFHEGSIDLGTDRGELKISLQHLWGAKDHLLGDFDYPTFASVLDHLSIKEFLRSLKPGLGKRTSFPFPRWLHLLTKGFQDRFPIVRPLVTEENMQRAIIDPIGFLEELISLLLVDPPGDKSRNDLVHRIETQPYPAFSILTVELLRARAVLLFFLTKQKEFIQLYLLKMKLYHQILRDSFYMIGGSLQPGRPGVLVQSHYPCCCSDTIAFYQTANRSIENLLLGFEIEKGGASPGREGLTTDLALQ